MTFRHTHIQTNAKHVTRKRKAILFFLLPLAGVFLVLAIVGFVRFVREPRRELGDRTLSILNGATRVETFRLDDSRDGDQVKDGTTGQEIADYPLTSQGSTRGPEFAAKLSRAVRDPRTFIGPNDTTCLINPGVAFRAWRGHECVEVIVCYHCQQMIVTMKDAQGHVVHSVYTEFGDLWSRSQFLALAKEAFPGDKAVQSLK